MRDLISMDFNENCFKLVNLVLDGIYEMEENQLWNKVKFIILKASDLTFYQFKNLI